MNNKQNNLELNKLIADIVKEILAEFAPINLKDNELAISLIDLTQSYIQPAVHHRGDEPTYPASIVKMFYLAAVQQWLEDKKIIETDEIIRACKDMIIDSSNDATHYVLDVLTNTTSGPELSADEMTVWSEKRNIVNRYFARLGYKNINVNQKTWGEGPFGRERVFYGQDFANRNKLTTNATAQLLAEIATGRCINKERSKIMLDLLARDFTKSSEDPDDQATGFMGSAMPAGARLWSKAGWMSTARHDAAYIELPQGMRFVLVVFTVNHAKEYGILPSVAAKIIQFLTTLKQHY